MKILEIFNRFEVMPQLREHHLRVAAVGQVICENLEDEINQDAVVEALLVHDLGNILKFDLSYFPEFVKPQGIAYWEDVRKRTAQRYATEDEHVATRKMAEEIGISKAALSSLDGIGFSQVTMRLDDPSYERKICCYADQRVSPFGVVTIQERLAEGKKRYENHPKGVEKFEQLANGLRKLEDHIFQKVRITPTDITDSSTKDIIEKLKEISIGQ